MNRKVLKEIKEFYSVNATGETTYRKHTTVGWLSYRGYVGYGSEFRLFRHLVTVIL